MQPAGENTIKRLTKIGDRKYQTRYGEFLVEGIRAVEEAFRAGAGVCDLIVRKGDERVGRIATLIDKAEELSVNAWIVSLSEMDKICRTTNSQGIAAGVKVPSKSIGDLFGEMLQIKSGTILFMDAIQDPGNVGTLIRTAEAFGIEAAVLGPGSAGLYNPKTIRSTMGAIFRVSAAEMNDRSAHDTVARFKKAGFRIIASNISERAVPIERLAPHAKNLLIVGSEASGISPELLQIADIEVYIPMTGPTESLNASIAGGILMFEIGKLGYRL